MKKQSGRKSSEAAGRGPLSSKVTLLLGKKKISFRVHPKFKRVLVKTAKRQGISMAEFTRRAIREHLPRIEDALPKIEAADR